MNGELIFKNRVEAGKDLAKKLDSFKGENTIIFGLPRGGIVVANEVAKALNVELQALPIRKLSLPERPEVAIGAMSFDGTIILNDQFILGLDIDKKQIDDEVESEKIRLKEMVEKFRNGSGLADLKGKTAIVVDDGVATGMTAKVALKTLRKYNPKKLILATPVISMDLLPEFEGLADKIIGNVVASLGAVGAFYEEFGQTTDEEVVEILNFKKN